jgi:hypothetical protein
VASFRKLTLKNETMKNFKKMALAAMVGALAIGFSAFTNADKIGNSKGNHINSTYYPVKLAGGGFDWEAINPLDYSCVTSTVGCTGVVAASAPAPNTIPSGYPVTNQILSN